MRHTSHGFSLLELALVLVIIALISGGIIAGSAMIRNAHVQKVITESQRFAEAIDNFRDKYVALPGDMTNAQDFWGTDPGGCPNPATGNPATPYVETRQPKTCNGNGDGFIFGTPSTPYEMFRAWQQLAAAGMVEGTYVGMAYNPGGATDCCHAGIGINVPASILPGGGYTLMYSAWPDDHANSWGIPRHVLVFGAQDSLRWTYAPVLTPIEAQSIDTKIDDGFPAFGNVMSYKSALTPGCTTSDTATISRYTSGDSDKLCVLNFVLGF